jgi:ribosome maturation factor RimP
MSSSSAGRRLATLLAPAVEQTGLDLDEVEVVSAGRRRQVRVVVDKDGGVSLDDVALVSQVISAKLDTPEGDDLLGSAAYVLEVSSPGVDRPLTQPRHWRRAVGRLVRASLLAGGDITGRVVAADADGVHFAECGSDGERLLRFDELGPGRVQVEFNRPSAGATGDANARDASDGFDAFDDDAPEEFE